MLHKLIETSNNKYLSHNEKIWDQFVTTLNWRYWSSAPMYSYWQEAPETRSPALISLLE